MARAEDPDREGKQQSLLRAQLARREALLGPTYRLFYEEPLHVVRGDGVFLYDPEGRPYLDAYNNVPCVGHSNPRVAAAVSEQMATLNTHTRYLEDGILDYAEALLESLGSGLRHAVFTCTGSEANDLAARIAMHNTGRRGFVVTRWAYHGNSYLTAGLSPALGNGFPDPPSLRRIPAPDTGADEEDDLVEAIADEFEGAIESLERDGHGFAAFIADSLFASDGIYARPQGLLKRLAEIARRRGGLFIADEVQSGFGRSGERFWGFERHHAEPDIVTMGKPMGNGYPIGATAISAEVIAAFGEQSRYFNTFGGSPVGIAAAQTTLDVINDEGLLENAEQVGKLIKSGLNDIAARHAEISEIRGAGLYIGADIQDPVSGNPDPAGAKRIVNRMKAAGTLISTTGERASTLKIRPPLIFNAVHAEQLLETLETALNP